MTSWYESLAAFDLETTGIDVTTSKIVSASLVQLDATGAVVRQRDWLVDPGEPIPAQATAVHGITTERARAEGAAAHLAVPEIVAAVREILDAGIALVVYNAPYDLSLLACETRRHGGSAIERPAPIVDPIIVDKQVDRYRRGKRTLALTAAHYGVPLDGAHDAAVDAIAAAHVAQAIGRQYSAELPTTAQELHDAQLGWAAAQYADFAAYMRRQVDPNWVSDRPAWPGGV